MFEFPVLCTVKSVLAACNNHIWYPVSGPHDPRPISADAASSDALAAGMGPGVLEIKCPFNRGQPESASVPSLPPWYYMPQVCLD